jgi:hypothetical protein
MEIKSSNNSKSVHDGKESYTLREEYDNGESKTVTIREVMNGYVIGIEHYTPYKSEKDMKGESGWENKEYISFTNPLDKSDKKDDKKDGKVSQDAIAKSINAFIGTMSNKLII